MFKNYFKTIFRNFKNNKVFFFISIIGLAIGLTCFVLIAVFVYEEMSYDTYAADAKNVYRVNLNITGNGNVAIHSFNFALLPYFKQLLQFTAQVIYSAVDAPAVNDAQSGPGIKCNKGNLQVSRCFFTAQQLAWLLISICFL